MGIEVIEVAQTGNQQGCLKLKPVRVGLMAIKKLTNNAGQVLVFHALDDILGRPEPFARQENNNG